MGNIGWAINSVALWVVVLIELALTLVIIRRINAKADSAVQDHGGPTVGETAPDFHAEDTTGRTVGLGDFLGRQVALLFVSPTCGPCLESLPKFIQAHDIGQGANVDVLLVSNSDAEQARTLVGDNTAMPVLVAPRDSNSFAADYNIRATPTYCLIDEHGVVQSAGFPSPDWGDWSRLVRSWERSPQPTAVALHH